MTKKIPVGATIARTYGFAFGNFLNNLGETWIPQVILLAAEYFLTPSYILAMRHIMPMPPNFASNPQSAAAAKAIVQNNLHVMATAAPHFALLIVFVLICGCAMIASVTKEALGVRTGSAFLQNPFGAATWRFLGSLLLFFLLMIVLYIATIVAVIIAVAIPALIASVGAMPMKVVAGIIGALAVTAVLCAFFYIVVRTGFLLAPAVVAEKRVTLLVGWRLTRGNFWRAFVLLLSVLVPLLVLEFVFLFVLLGSQWLPPMHAGTTPQEITAWSQQLNQRAFDFADSNRRLWYVTYPIGLVMGTALYGLFAGLPAFAYRALTEEHEAASAAPGRTNS